MLTIHNLVGGINLNIEELSEFLNEKFPEELSEINSSIFLLNESLEQTKDSISNSIADLLKEDNHAEAREYIDASEQLKEYINELDSLIDGINQITSKNTDKIKSHDYEEYSVDNKKPHSLDEDFKFKRPYAFVLKESGKKVHNWRKMLKETCNFLIDIDENKFENFITDDDFKGRKRDYISHNTNKMNSPIEVGNEDNNFYVEGNLSANSIIDLIKKLLLKYDIDLDLSLIHI